MLRITEPGIYTMPKADYHADPCPTPSASSSFVRRMMSTCPAKAWHERQNPRKPTEALDFGDAAHEWLLEGDAWPQRHVVLPEDYDGRTKAGKEAVAAIESQGKQPLKYEAFETVKGMVSALRAHDYAGAAFTNGTAEQSLFWKDEETGIWCRARLDWLTEGATFFPDYKTARSVRPDDLSRAMWDYGLHMQADWYETGLRALGICAKPRLLLIAQEKVAPYLVVPFLPDADAMGWAAMQNRRARHIFADCLASGKWPGYVEDVATLPLPGWAQTNLTKQSESGLFEIAYRMQAPVEPVEMENAQ